LTEKDKFRRGRERRCKWREERGEGGEGMIREVRARRWMELKCGVWRRRRSFDIFLAERNLCAETEEEEGEEELGSKEKEKEKGQVSTTSSGYGLSPCHILVLPFKPLRSNFLFAFWKFLQTVDISYI
jgi:hypothetical protein